MTQSWRPDEWADDEAWRGDLHCDAEPWRAGVSDERWRGQEHVADWPEAQAGPEYWMRSEEHTSELQSRGHLVCRLLLEKKKHAGPSSHDSGRFGPSALEAL